EKVGVGRSLRDVPGGRSLSRTAAGEARGAGSVGGPQAEREADRVVVVAAGGVPAELPAGGVLGGAIAELLANGGGFAAPVVGVEREGAEFGGGDERAPELGFRLCREHERFDDRAELAREPFGDPQPEPRGVEAQPFEPPRAKGLPGELFGSFQAGPLERWVVED